ILGPSGSGKTTIIKLIAGFESSDNGDIFLNGIKVNNLPANKREVNTVFQNYSLFPHMNVYDNIAFGLRMKKKSQDYIDNAVSNSLKLIKMEKFADRKPGELSGGQQQRVAVARAIVNKPLILLLDEPLSALDEKLRKEMQVELKSMQRDLGITFILVTHDQEEALSISDTVIVINNGKIEQIGSPQEIYQTPVNSFVASFVGELNILDAKVEAVKENLLTVIVEEKCKYQLENKNNFSAGEQIKILIRPENLRLSLEKDSVTLTRLKGKVTQTKYRGALLDYVITLDNDKKITATLLQNKEGEICEYKIGMEVFVEWTIGCEVLTT
ncbi:MAG: polyamine ABC transporter ATP-binding protein, partial [Alphaproteobacteria bacterium]|nr:polyamine ABC transporter ATP-binding protein [Alphaproteobacteria bacterium]